MNLPPFLPFHTALPLLPSVPGSYILRLWLDRPRRITVGRLGEYDLPEGVYLYCGSAFGPGGVRARVLRHAGGRGKPHWHVDALRAEAELEAVAWQANLRAECDWSQHLASLAGANVPIPGFGASDCRNGCPAHLIRAGSHLDISFISSGFVV